MFKIAFPFPIKQIDERTVKIEMAPGGRPLVEMQFHPDLKLSDKKVDEIWDMVVNEAIKASIVVTGGAQG